MSRLGLMRKGETALCFALHFNECIAGREKILCGVEAAVPSHEDEAADIVRYPETKPEQISPSANVFCIRHQVICEHQIGPRLKARQPLSFDEFVAHLAETKRCLAVAETVASDEPQSHIHIARRVAVAMQHAKICRPAHG